MSTVDWTGRTAGFVVAVVLVVAGIALVSVTDGDGVFDQENEPFEQEAEEGPGGGEFDASWWLGVGAIVVGVLLGIWAWTWGPAEEY